MARCRFRPCYDSPVFWTAGYEYGPSDASGLAATTWSDVIATTVVYLLFVVVRIVGRRASAGASPRYNIMCASAYILITSPVAGAPAPRFYCRTKGPCPRAAVDAL